MSRVYVFAYYTSSVCACCIVKGSNGSHTIWQGSQDIVDASAQGTDSICSILNKRHPLRETSAELPDRLCYT